MIYLSDFWDLFLYGLGGTTARPPKLALARHPQLQPVYDHSIMAKPGGAPLRVLNALVEQANRRART